MGWRRRVLFCILIAAVGGCSRIPYAAVTVTVDPSVEYQTILGWGATSPWFTASAALRGQILDEAVNELGLNRLRLEPPGGNKSQQVRWEWLNDNDDPDQVDWSKLSTKEVDEKVSNWVVPFKDRVEANGDPFDLYVSPSFFDGGSSGSVPTWILHSPGEYAEYATSFLLRLKNQHNVTATYYCICNEAGNNNPFTAEVVGRMIRALGPKMKALGLTTRIQFPECVNANMSWDYIQALRDDEEVWRYVGAVSYHLYGGNSAMPQIRDFAVSRGLPTGQTEYMGLTMDHLYDDITLGGVSYWELYGDWISPHRNRTSFNRGSRHWSFRQVLHYVRPGDVRIGASSDNAAVRTLAFRRDGRIVLVLINTTAPHQARQVIVDGLPAGSYGSCQSVGNGVYTELGLRSVAEKDNLTLNLPANTVLTLYPYPGTPLPPTITEWKAAPSYLTLPSSSAILSASATDPEKNSLSYAWSVAEQPAAAHCELATPNAATSSVTGLTATGHYAFRVTVSDGTASVSREVLLDVHAGNEPPVLDDVHNRLPVMLTLPTSSTSLRGWALDLEGDPLTFQWTVVSQPPGANVSLTNAATSNCTASEMDVAGDYIFRFEVRDPTHTVTKNLTVTVYPENSAPFIKSAAASPSTLTLPTVSTTRLSATTGDRDGDGVSHWWSVKSAPAGARPVFATQGQRETVVSHLIVPGPYVFTLTVVDRSRHASRDVVVTVGGTPAAPSVTACGRGNGDSVSLAWTDFAPTYTVEGATNLQEGDWRAVPPGNQWPLLITSWTADEPPEGERTFYRVKGE